MCEALQIKIFFNNRNKEIWISVKLGTNKWTNDKDFPFFEKFVDERGKENLVLEKLERGWTAENVVLFKIQSLLLYQQNILRIYNILLLMLLVHYQELGEVGAKWIY